MRRFENESIKRKRYNNRRGICQAEKNKSLTKYENDIAKKHIIRAESVQQNKKQRSII